MNLYFKSDLIFLIFLFNLPIAQAHKHRKRSSQHNDDFLNFRFLQEPQNAVIGDKPIIFNCSFEVRSGHNVESVIVWRKDDLRLDGNKAYIVIDKFNKSSEGLYQCVVKLKLDSTEWVYLSRKAKLIQPKLGNFAQQPISQKIFDGQFVAFRCALDAETNVRFADLFHFEWFHNNKRINSSDRIGILPLTHTLEISNAQRSDSGNYSCTIRNGKSSITSQTAFLDVLEGSASNGAISFALQPKFQTVKENGEIVLECLTNGLPKPLVTWLHNSHIIDEKLNKYKRIGVDNSSLLIKNIQASDSGLYSCEAKTTEDLTHASANVVVQSIPQIIKGPRSIRMQETMDVEFECSVKGGIEVNWVKNGENVQPSEYFVVNGNKLKIYGLIRDDQAIYQCFIDSDESAQASAQLIVDEAALTQALTADRLNELREPLGLHAQSVGTRSIRLKWDPPIGLITTNKIAYSVFFRVENSTSENIANSSTPSLTLTSLEPNSIYSIRVSAVDNNKLGKSSAPISVHTKPEEVEIGQVRNLRVSVLNADSAEVEWDSPFMSVPRSLRYKFFYKRLNTPKEEEIQSVVVKTSYALHSLRKNSEYSVRVQVVDGTNTGPASPPINFRTYSDVPEGPPININLDSPEFGSLRIRWSPPPVDQQNGNLTSYKIRYKTKGRSSKSLVAVANADVNEHTITGLDTGLMYQVRIAAQNQNGTGPFSEWVNVELPAEDQGNEISPAPSELKVFAGYDSIHVSWLPPRESSVMIQGYSVGWGVYVPDREKTNVGAEERQYTINGLKPNRDYVISVRAITRAGDGFPIYETVKTTSHPQPSINDNIDKFVKTSSSLVPPIGVQAESISSSSIRVSWTDPNNIFNQLYSIRYSPSGNTNQQVWQYVNTSESEALIDELEPNTQYEFAVRLIESQMWSMSALTRTQIAPPSSAPRDLTVFPTELGDPNSVYVNWQPPKYANGDVEEYIILYSDHLDYPDRDWIVDSAKGDRLSIKISGLLPKSTYYFKIHARNAKGYGPLSPVVTFIPGKINSPNDVYSQVDNTDAKRSNSQLLELIVEAARENILYVIVGTCLLMFFLVLVIICLCRRGDSAEKIRRHNGYVAGRKLSSVNRTNGPDCWIEHPSNRVELLGVPPASTNFAEMRQFSTCAVDSPPPRYQHHGLSPTRRIPPTVSFAVDRQSNRKSLPPLSINTTNNTLNQSIFHGSPARRPASQRGILRSSATTKNNSDSLINSMTQSSYESTNLTDPETFGNLYASRRLSTYGTVYDGLSTTRKLSKDSTNELWRRGATEFENGSSNNASNGTIPRNYHHSSISLERQKTPQILYTGTNRQHINKIDLSSDRGSSFGGSNTILQMSSTPPLVGEGGYQTVRQANNPLRSFVNMNVPPPSDRMPSSQSPSQLEPRIANVRPVVVASPNNIRASSAGIRPAGIVIGQRSTTSGLAPVGLIHAQPRVNVASIYSPYQSTLGSKEDVRTQNTDDLDQLSKEMPRPVSANSAEIVNPQQFDKMINTLQQLQHQFEN